MKHLILLLAVSLISTYSNTKELLFECGTNAKANFNGWQVEPYQAFDNISFTENEIEIYSENGGDYSISLIKKIEDMVGYSTLFIDMNFDVRNNCEINYANVYLSKNGKTWDAIPDRADLENVQITNSLMNYTFVKTVIDVRFFENGILSFNHFKVEGEYESNEIQEEAIVSQLPKPTNADPKFHIFSYQKVINVETKSDLDYEIYISDIKGQVVYHSDKNGSSRIEANYPNGIYIISIIQDNRIVSTKKLVL